MKKGARPTFAILDETRPAPLPAVTLAIFESAVVAAEKEARGEALYSRADRLRAEAMAVVLAPIVGVDPVEALDDPGLVLAAAKRLR